MAGPEATPVPARPATAGNVLIRPADPTQVIPRIRPDVPPPWLAGANTDTASLTDTDDNDNRDTADSEARNDEADDADYTDHTDLRRRTRPGWVWAGLAVFWLLAIGAGVVTLASLGAPHYLCTGSGAKGLACNSTGTVLAAILTVVLIVAVGTVSVLTIETRATGRAASRWLGIGVVTLVVVAGCGYLLIRTIGG